VGQGGLKVLHIWCYSQKIRTPQPKSFFELLHRSIALTRNSHAKPRAFQCFFLKSPKAVGHQSVNMSISVSKLSFYTDVNPCSQKQHTTKQNNSLIIQEDFKMLALQSMIKYSISKQCFHHEQGLLKKFSLQWRNFSDPFNIHPTKQRTK